MIMVLMLGACSNTAQTPEPTPAPADCVANNQCVANNPSLKCCTEGFTLQKDSTTCPVADGVVGGMPMTCKGSASEASAR